MVDFYMELRKRNNVHVSGGNLLLFKRKVVEKVKLKEKCDNKEKVVLQKVRQWDQFKRRSFICAIKR